MVVKMADEMAGATEKRWATTMVVMKDVQLETLWVTRMGVTMASQWADMMAQSSVVVTVGGWVVMKAENLVGKMEDLKAIAMEMIMGLVTAGPTDQSRVEW